MLNEIERGQMLVFVYGPRKTTTARLPVSEKNLDLVFSAATRIHLMFHESRDIC